MALSIDIYKSSGEPLDTSNFWRTTDVSIGTVRDTNIRVIDVKVGGIPVQLWVTDKNDLDTFGLILASRYSSSNIKKYLSYGAQIKEQDYEIVGATLNEFGGYSWNPPYSAKCGLAIRPVTSKNEKIYFIPLNNAVDSISMALLDEKPVFVAKEIYNEVLRQIEKAAKGSSGDLRGHVFAISA